MPLAAPLPLVGRGGGGGREASTLNHFEHTVDVAKDFIVPETQDAIALGLKKFRSHCILLALYRVLPAVNFNHDLQAMTREIDDIAAEMNLTAKMRGGQRKPMT